MLTFDSQTRDALGAGLLRSRSTNYGIYGVVDQDIVNSGGHTASGFVRVGGAPSDVNFVDFYLDGGFNFTGFVPGLTKDIAGVAVAYSSISGDFTDSQRARDLPGYSAETVVEATYRAVIAPWWLVQPDLQYVFNPGNQHGSRDALVLGMRTSVSF